MDRCTGKWGRAVVINTNTTAQESGEEEQESITEPKPRTTSHVTLPAHESHVIDLYEVDKKSGKHQRDCMVKPFIHQVRFHGPKGEVVRIWALFDEGAMREAMSTETFHKVKHRLGPVSPSSMADGQWGHSGFFGDVAW